MVKKAFPLKTTTYIREHSKVLTVKKLSSKIIEATQVVILLQKIACCVTGYADLLFTYTNHEYKLSNDLVGDKCG
jgi:hypothetical protein